MIGANFNMKRAIWQYGTSCTRFSHKSGSRWYSTWEKTKWEYRRDFKEELYIVRNQFWAKKLEYYIHAGYPRKFGNKYKYPTPNFVVHPVAKVLGPDNDIFFWSLQRLQHWSCDEESNGECGKALCSSWHFRRAQQNSDCFRTLRATLLQRSFKYILE